MNADDILAVANAQRQTTQEPQTSDTDRDSDLWPEIRRIIETRMSSQPRDLQREIGPSELGTSCVHCLAAKLAGWPERRRPAWLPFIGTCVHARFEQWFGEAEETVFTGPAPEDERRRFVPEMRVTVGHLQGLHAGYDVKGSIDLYDRKTGSTIDWKIVGNTTLTKVKAHGPSQQYRVQASLYGIGLKNRGGIGAGKPHLFSAAQQGRPERRAPVAGRVRPETGVVGARQGPAAGQPDGLHRTGRGARGAGQLDQAIAVGRIRRVLPVQGQSMAGHGPAA